MKSFSKMLLGHEIFSPMVPCATNYTAQKMKFSIRDFFSKCGQIRSFAVFEKIVKPSTTTPPPSLPPSYILNVHSLKLIFAIPETALCW